MAVMIPVSWGELFDKLTILEIKQERIDDPEKRANITRELETLSQISTSEVSNDSLHPLTRELRAVNERLWEIEDEIRVCERAGDFSSHFVELARSVYKTNDRRAELKKLISLLLGSELVEEKSYQAY